MSDEILVRKSLYKQMTIDNGRYKCPECSYSSKRKDQVCNHFVKNHKKKGKKKRKKLSILLKKEKKFRFLTFFFSGTTCACVSVNYCAGIYKKSTAQDIGTIKCSFPNFTFENAQQLIQADVEIASELTCNVFSIVNYAMENTNFQEYLKTSEEEFDPYFIYLLLNHRKAEEKLPRHQHVSQKFSINLHLRTILK